MPHDGFISYSHGADGRLAPALQAGLQRFARPWYRRRALDIFRDDTGLSASPHLWTSIEAALDDSRYFVLMASPEAAASPWVQREIDRWLETKTGARLRILPVLTDGDLVWDDAAGDYDRARSSALPPNLWGQFEEEPRHVDLRWARDEEHLDLRHTRFRDAVADLAATIHGIPKDELEGQDVRRHRRAVRTAVAAVIVLVALTLAALASSVLAVRAQRSSDRNAARADHQASVARANLAQARSRQLTSLLGADGAVPDARVRLLLAVQANEFAATRESRDALFREMRTYSPGDAAVRTDSLGDHGYDELFLSTFPLPVPIRSGVVLSPDASTFAVSAPDGTVDLFDIARGRRRAELRGTARVPAASVVIASNNRVVAAQWEGEVVVAAHGGSSRVATSTGSARGLTAAPGGEWLVALTGPSGDPGGDATLSLLRLDSDGRVREVGERSVVPEASDVRFTGPRRLVVRTDAALLEFRAGPEGLRRTRTETDRLRVEPCAVCQTPPSGFTEAPFDPVVVMVPGQHAALELGDVVRGDDPVGLHHWVLRLRDLEAESVRQSREVGGLNTETVRLVARADGEAMAVLTTYGSLGGTLSPPYPAGIVAPWELDGWTSPRELVTPGTTVQLFDPRDLQSVGPAFYTPEVPVAVSFGSAGRSLVWVDDTSTVHRLDLDVEGTWIPAACRLAGRALSRDEFRQYVGVPAGDQHRACAAPDR